MPIVYLKPGEADDFQLNFGARMTGGITASAAGLWLPANIGLSASSLLASAINMRLYSATASYVYTISGYIDTSNGKRLIDVFDIHCG